MNPSQIKALLRKYTEIISTLRTEGVIKTSKVVADYGEWLVAQKLNLQLVDSPINKGFDALDNKGEKYEIKTRKETAWNSPKNSPVSAAKIQNADFLICVELDNDWNIKYILKIPSKEVKPNKHSKLAISKGLKSKYSIKV